MVKRYKNTMHMFAGEYGDSLDEHPEGDWIEYEHYAALEAKCHELEAALLDLYSGTAEYVYLNHLGDPHNTTPMRNAAKVLGAPALEAYDRLRALTEKTKIDDGPKFGGWNPDL